MSEDTKLEIHGDHKEESWKRYTLEEYQWLVNLFCKRSTFRTSLEKRAKDLCEARNYLLMLSNRAEIEDNEEAKTLVVKLQASVDKHQELCKTKCSSECNSNCQCEKFECNLDCQCDKTEEKIAQNKTNCDQKSC